MEFLRKHKFRSKMEKMEWFHLRTAILNHMTTWSKDYVTWWFGTLNNLPSLMAIEVDRFRQNRTRPNFFLFFWKKIFLVVYLLDKILILTRKKNYLLK